MMKNEVIESLLDHKSIREYLDETPSDEEIETIVKAGQQAAFSSQLYSVIIEKDKDSIPFGAPLLFTICADIHKLELFMEKRGWDLKTNDLTLLMFAVQDASYMAQNMVATAESLDMGTCYLGGALWKADKLKEKYNLPEGVFPFVQLTVGYPAEYPPTRPRYPLEFTLFEDEYPDVDDDTLEDAMEEMDEGYLEQDYYRILNGMISIQIDDKEEEYTLDDYSWTEHISRKWGQWFPEVKEQLEKIEECGFEICPKEED